jgi:hypothetical protein
VINSKFVPVCLFTYNRLDETKRTVEALQKNYLAEKTDLYVFVDGPKRNQSSAKVDQVYSYIQTIIGFKSITIIRSQSNKGLANSVIEGVSYVLKNFDKIIILEDDLITSPNFLDFMNQALAFYEKNENIFSVSGWSLKLNSLNTVTSDYYFHYRMSSWGWGIWKNRWEKINWDKSYFVDFKANKQKQKLFGKIGADMPKMLLDYLEGKNSSWAIRACYAQHELGKYTLAPKQSKVNNIGFGDTATHTKYRNRFDQKIENSEKRNFEFKNEIFILDKVISEYKNKYSKVARIRSRLNHILSKYLKHNYHIE